MKANEYRFVDRWRIRGTVEEITEIFRDGEGFTRWWPSVYLKLKKTKTGLPDGTGDSIEALVKGWLPYTLHLFFTTTETYHPHGFAMDVTGDFTGRGIWTFEQDGDFVNLTYDWRVRADHPLLRYGSPIVKPLFESNHHWCMRKGEESLQLELARRHALTPKEREAIHAPPGPISKLPWLVGGLALALLVIKRVSSLRER